MEVYKSKYWAISFEDSDKILVPRWNKESAALTDDLYKVEMTKYTELVEQHRPEKALIDCMNFYFAIVPELQEWINSEMFPRIIAVGVNKIAILMPSEIITQLSLEQVMDEANGAQFTTDYFSDEAAARKWLTE